MNANFLTREQAIRTFLEPPLIAADLDPEDYDLNHAAIEMLECEDETGWYLAVSSADFDRVVSNYYIGDADYDDPDASSL